MESDLLSINVETKLKIAEEEPQQIINEIEFALKKNLTPEGLAKIRSERINVITNYFEYKIIKNSKNITIYSIKLIPMNGMEIKTDFTYTNLIMNKIRNDSLFKSEMEKYFNFYLISGHNLFGQPKVQDLEIVQMKIYYDPVKMVADVVKLVDSIPNEKDEKKEFLLEILEVSNLRSISTKESQEVDRRFINIQNGVKLRGKEYIKSIVSRKVIYHKNFEKFPQVKIFLNNDNNKFYHPGYQISANYYENDTQLLKVVPRYRLCQTLTFSDHLFDLSSRFNPPTANQIFFNDCKGAKGLKSYDLLDVRIDGVIEADPSNLYFESSNGKINLIQYYFKRWNIKLQSGPQNIFYNIKKMKNYETGIIEEKTLYFIPKLIFIVGYLPSQLEKTRPKSLIQRPEEKLDSIFQVMRDLTSMTNLNENQLREKIYNIEIKYDALKTEAILLHLPEIQFKKTTVKPDETGKFNTINEPYQNEKLSNVLVILYDCSADDGGKIYNYLIESSKSLNMEIVKAPETKTIYASIDNLKDKLDHYLKEIQMEELKKTKDKRFEIVFFFTSRKNRNTAYSIFKDCMNNSGMRIPSQVVLIESANRFVEKNDKSYFTNILTQIWAKRDLLVWRIGMDSSLRNTVIISIAVTLNNVLGKNLTTVGITLDRYYSSMVFLSNYDEGEGGTFLSTNIQQLIKEAYQIYYKVTGKNIENILIFREGMNESQISLAKSLEFEAIQRAVNDIKIQFNLNQAPKICLIVVNKVCDTKLFLYDPNNKKEVEGLEQFSINQSYNYNNRFVVNVPVGTLIESKIVSSKIWEFYLNSSYAIQGTNNPTHYIVALDNTSLAPEVIYKTVYNLSFTYFNTSKSIRFPSTLHRVIRRNQFIIKNITGYINTMPYVDFSM